MRHRNKLGYYLPLIIIVLILVIFGLSLSGSLLSSETTWVTIIALLAIAFLIIVIKKWEKVKKAIKIVPQTLTLIPSFRGTKIFKKKPLVTFLLFVLTHLAITYAFYVLWHPAFVLWYNGGNFWFTHLVLLVGFAIFSIGYKNFSYVFFVLGGILILASLADTSATRTRNSDGTVTITVYPNTTTPDKIRIPYDQVHYEFRNVKIKTQNGVEKTILSEARADVLGENLKSSDDFFEAKSMTPSDTCYVQITFIPNSNRGYKWNW